QNVDEMVPMTVSEGGGLPHVMNQVRIITALLDGPNVDASRARKRRFKYRSPIACEGKWPDEVEGYVRRSADGGFCWQHCGVPFVRPSNSGIVRPSWAAVNEKKRSASFPVEQVCLAHRSGKEADRGAGSFSHSPGARCHGLRKEEPSSFRQQRLIQVRS